MPTVTLRGGTARRFVAVAPERSIGIALLGFGTIGSAVAELAAGSMEPWLMHVTGALVRDTARPRRVAGVDLVTDAGALLATGADVVVEVLGGVEPARSLVAAALERRVPVVTANKSLMAACGGDLLDLAARRRTTLLYEASVLAGVPCLGGFGRRPRASAATAITGIVNGTSNFILGRMQAPSLDCAQALAEAQRLGLAEPDPRNDLLGIDAAEKLVVLSRHFGLGTFRPSDVETTSVAGLRASDFAAAAEFGAVIKPVVHASRRGSEVHAFSGPALLPALHKLARVDGADNAITVRNGYGDLVYAGPGAGPVATATTILDDVGEAVSGWPGHAIVRTPAARVIAPVTAWFVRLASRSLPPAEEIADLLGSHGIWLRRSAEVPSHGGSPARYLLTYACARDRAETALRALEDACGCEAFAIRAMEG